MKIYLGTKQSYKHLSTCRPEPSAYHNESTRSHQYLIGDKSKRSRQVVHTSTSSDFIKNKIKQNVRKQGGAP